MQKLNKLAFIYAIILALIVWFSVILQFIISTAAYMQQGRTFGGALVQIISFFTILSNILVGLCLVAVVLNKASAFKKFFNNNSVVTAVALYITIVGLIFNTVLRSIVNLDGLFALTNELTHVFNPVAFVIFWLFFTAKTKLSWQQAASWLWYPLLYLIYILIRGAVFHFYPYPFVDADKLGYQQVAVNSFLVMMAFLLFGCLFLVLNNKLATRTYQ
ncbi:Pr6Pr family membrane protein [Mucilaginibacter sp. OK283]|uniref:Pr6Pr family membrane protein n=1 Tax=Mucilaginibacter sp. OK283 TaxID=1881049 RepID=UPI0015A4FEC4|nr:Pr6Pr family membrane protein [Mucilaginibacter sp. OK283]